MKYTLRVLSLVLVCGLLLASVAGCSAPKLTLGGTPKTAGTIAGREISTGEYLAYLYGVYFNMGLYQYSQYGMDVWSQEMTYGDGEDAPTVSMQEYVQLAARDSMVTQEAARQLMEKYNIQWDAEALKEVEKSFADVEGEGWLSVGVNREHMMDMYKNTELNQYSLLLGLYGKGGQREVADKDIRKYFDDNYLSYKIVSIALTDDDGKELSADKKKEKTDLLKGYLDEYNTNKNFEAIVDKYAKSIADKDETVEPSKDEDNRRDVDATNIDEYLAKEIRKLTVGTAAVVEYKANGSTPTAALILRLDPNDPAKKLYEDSYENILSALKGEELEKEITELAKKVVIDLKKSVVKKCDPKNFDTPAV